MIMDGIKMEEGDGEKESIIDGNEYFMEGRILLRSNREIM
jgi:hypothetical protein